MVIKHGEHMAVPKTKWVDTVDTAQVASHPATPGVDEALWRCPGGCALAGTVMVFVVQQREYIFMEYQ